MKRIKMPLWARMQTFLFLPNDEIFWTSASLTIPQKLHNLYLMIVCWFKGEKYIKQEMCNTSRGYTLPWHGQMLRYDGYHFIHDWWVDANYYDIHSGKYIHTEPTKLHDLMGIKALCPNKSLQGVSFKGGKFDYASFGNADKGSIKVFNIETGVMHQKIYYHDFKERYWKSWEAEGLQYNLDGDLVIGISVKTIFGTIRNYWHKL